MSNRERSREKYPALFAYGPTHKFLDTESATRTTAENRIRSIWPFIVRRVISFHWSLKPREKANFDPEDVLMELFVVLFDKDDQWQPERGRYITFAAVLIDRKLCSIRDKSRTIESPRNSAGRMKEYQTEDEKGTISSRRLKTCNDIRRSSNGTCSVDSVNDEGGKFNHPSDTREPVDILMGDEREGAHREAIRFAIRHCDLTPLESTVVGRLAGLWRHERQSVKEIAFHLERETKDVRRAKLSAHQKIRRYLISVGYPAIPIPE